MDENIYLKYLYCCKFTTNNKIKDLLEDLAIRNIKCSLSNNLESYKDNYYKLYLDVLKYFKVKESIKNKDIKPIKSWASAKKKITKDLVLKKYIIHVKYMYQFDDKTVDRLIRDLMIGINLKNINDKNIIFEDNNIVKIIGLNLYTNSYSWDFDIFSI